MIREYQPSDVHGVVRVWREASAVAHSFLTSAFLDDEEVRVRDVHLATARTWVFEVDGEVLGFISLVGNEIGGLFVRPDRHRAGIGAALVDMTTALYPTLEVEVFRANEIGLSFYVKYGFELIQESVHEATGHKVLRLRYVARPNEARGSVLL